MGKKSLSFCTYVSAGPSLIKAHRKALLIQWTDPKQCQLRTSILTSGKIPQRLFLIAYNIEILPLNNSLKLRRSSLDQLVTHIMGP